MRLWGWQPPEIIVGESVPGLSVIRDLPWLARQRSSQQARDLQRFQAFSSGYLAFAGVDSRGRYLVVDPRYSMLPNSTEALWGIALSPGAAETEHADYLNLRRPQDRDLALAKLWQMVVSGNSYPDRP